MPDLPTTPSEKDLTTKRRLLKSSVTKMETFVFTEVTADTRNCVLTMKKSRLEELFREYASIQVQLESLDDKYIGDYDIVDKQFDKIMDKLVTLIDDRAPRASPTSGNGSIASIASRIKLSKVSLPTFSGDYKEWPSFKDLFLNLVHNCNEITEVEKLYHLKLCLKGEAGRLIQNIESTGDNYESAWSEVLNRYDNKLLIVNKHLKAIIELSKTSKGCGSSLRSLISNFKQHYSCLESLKLASLSDTILIYLISQKVDTDTLCAFQMQQKADSIPSLNQFLDYLQEKAAALELNARAEVKPQKHTTHNTVVKKNTVCNFCSNGNHPLFRCYKFNEVDVQKRYQFVKQMQLCTNCLKNHKGPCSSNFKCNSCGRRHHSLLHVTEKSHASPINNSEATSPRKASSAAESSSEFYKPPIFRKYQDNVMQKIVDGPDKTTVPSSSQTLVASSSSESVMLMATAIVDVAAGGERIPCRVLLDNASERNFVSADIISQLNVDTEKCNWLVGGVGGVSATVQETVELTICSRYSNAQFNATFGILPVISDLTPKTTFAKQSLRWPSFVKLADPTFNVKNKVDMLIGIELFYNIIQKGKIDLGPEQPILQETQFGWVVVGPTNPKDVQIKQKTKLQRYSCHLTAAESQTNSLAETISRFWTLEEIPKEIHLTKSEKLCEQIYVNSVSRTSSGRYEVDLPVTKDKLNCLGNSFKYALRCMLALEKRFQRDPALFVQYREFISEYLSLGHAHIVDLTNDHEENVFYMPHHAVIKPSSSTTKLRVVFNASAPSSSGLSLNDILLAGPVVQPDLFEILLRFRTYKYVITADIKKMYRQVNVKPQYQALQRIVWRDNPNVDLKVLQLSTATYGTRPASFLATRTLVQLAHDEGDSYPLAAQALLTNSYVDDIITGANDFRTVVDLRDQLIQLLGKGCFELHKWCSNHSSILDSIALDKLEVPNFIFSDSKDSVKALGMLWSPQVDEFLVNLPSLLVPEKITKRGVLSGIASIFDPLGFIAPVTTTAKIFLQDLWKQQCSWDDPIKPIFKTHWNKFVNELRKIGSISVPRYLLPLESFNQIEIHGFSDASEKAYGACCYLVQSDHNKVRVSTLICAKSRVAPIKTISLPRLELCAAVLLVKLMKKVKCILQLPYERSIFWTDSTIVLSWINSEPSRWSTFVANRTACIQNSSSPADWHHVPSSSNPADLVSRGVFPDELQKCPIWWNGPEFLKHSELSWPLLKTIKITNEATNEEKVKKVSTHIQTSLADSSFEFWNNYFLRFSSIRKLQRVLAFLFRYIKNCRRQGRLNDTLSTRELKNSMQFIIKVVQHQFFKSEIKEIQLAKVTNCAPCIKNSRLKLLCPFVDGEDVLRVGGRLKHASIPFNQKYPAILPYNSHVTYLIIKSEHEHLLHAGLQSTLANLRLKYWPLNARRAVSSVIHKCLNCCKMRASTSTQIMSDLPEFRVNPARPFQFVGLDYAGPIHLKQSRIRRAIVTKGYICLFVCMVTKALHLELVSDMTTNSFLSALRRFISRRGRPSNIFSDNGKNFIGAKNELNELYGTLNNKSSAARIRDYAADEAIQWTFIPPAAPHWGGIWEAGVKSVKHHLRRTMGNTTLTYEEFNTLLVQIEGILNSRPLTPVGNDVDELDCLTPAHFLIGSSLRSIPEEGSSEVRVVNRLSAYRHIEHLKACFWKKWSREYLCHLQQRRKWNSVQPNVPENSVVLVKNENLPPLQWCVGRVIETIAGKDGLVRTVKVKTKNGIYVRPITKICVLPTDN